MYSAAVNGNAAMIELLLECRRGREHVAAGRRDAADDRGAHRQGRRGAGAAGARRHGQCQGTLEAADGADVGRARRQRRDGEAARSTPAPTLDDRSIFGWTPLLFAARQGQVGAIKALVAAGRGRQRDAARQAPARWSPRCRGSTTRPPASCWSTGSIPTPPARAGRRCTRSCGRGGRSAARTIPARSRSGDLSSLDLAKKLVEHGADINARETKEPNSDMEGRNSLNRYGATPFFLAAKSVRRADDGGAAGARRRSVHRQRRRRHAADGGRGRRRLFAGRESGRARGIGRSREDAAGPGRRR